MAGTALGQAETMDRPFSLAFALQRTSILCQLEHAALPAREVVDRFLTLHTEYPAAHWLPWILIIRAWRQAAEDRLDAALADLEQAWPLWHVRGGSEFLGPYFRCVAVEIHLAAGQHDRARQLLDEAFALQEATGQRHWAAELHRNRAALALAVDPTEVEAEEELCAALAIAREQSAKSLELRASRDLAGLWAKRGERQRACDLLAPVHGWFTEGFDTPDLVEARVLLDRLG